MSSIQRKLGPGTIPKKVVSKNNSSKKIVEGDKTIAKEVKKATGKIRIADEVRLRSAVLGSSSMEKRKIVNSEDIHTVSIENLMKRVSSRNSEVKNNALTELLSRYDLGIKDPIQRKSVLDKLKESGNEQIISDLKVVVAQKKRSF